MPHQCGGVSLAFGVKIAAARSRVREPKFYYITDPTNLSIGKPHKKQKNYSPIIVQHYHLHFAYRCAIILVQGVRKIKVACECVNLSGGVLETKTEFYQTKRSENNFLKPLDN